MGTDITNSSNLARQLARFVTKASTEEFSPRLLELAKMVVASTLASAARGYRIGCVEAFRTVALESGGAPDATLWFNGTKVPAAAAVDGPPKCPMRRRQVSSIPGASLLALFTPAAAAAWTLVPLNHSVASGAPPSSSASVRNAWTPPMR